MLFNSFIFLFLFLPVAFALHWATPSFLRNTVLLALSLVFYWWGGSNVILILFTSIGLNWIFGLVIGLNRRSSVRIFALAVGVSLNLAGLIYFKYFTLFFSALFHLSPSNLPDAVIPLGLSFYTFHSISYLVDLSREKKSPFINPIDFALYITLFPQLLAGPIVRFHDISDQIVHRSLSWDLLFSGAQRFIFGLAKKVLLADYLGRVSDHVFSLQNSELSFANAWLGILCFTLEIYYDFSGYSDMAIGLSRMFGFQLLENFNYPYLANSITDFWHRWHLSLSAWFRDYLFIPLGGSRGSTLETYRNLLAVFLLCGLWHGANWTFVLWGAYNGLFLIFERNINLEKWLPFWARHVYAIIVVMFGWVLFRISSFDHACEFMATMVGLHTGPNYGQAIALILTPQFYLSLAIGCLLAFPVFMFMASDFEVRLFPNRVTRLARMPQPLLGFIHDHPVLLAATRSVVCLALLFLCTSEMAVNTAHSFIYFNF